MMRWLVLVALVLPLVFPLLGCQNNRPDILAIYEKTGGIAGLDERLVVRERGGAGILTLEDTRADRIYEAGVEPGEFDALRRTLGSEAFLSTDRAYRVDRGADLITYTIEGRAAERTHTVTTMDSAAHPPVVGRAIADLERLLHLARDTGAPRAD